MLAGGSQGAKPYQLEADIDPSRGKLVWKSMLGSCKEDKPYQLPPNRPSEREVGTDMPVQVKKRTGHFQEKWAG